MKVEDFDELNKLLEEFKKINIKGWRITNINPVSINHGEITIKLKKELNLNEFKDIKNPNKILNKENDK